MNTLILAAALLAAPAPLAAQGAAAPTTAEVSVGIQTSLGQIVVSLDPVHAPVTTANFLKYVDTHRFDGQTFYRAMRATDGSPVLIQGGISSDARKLLPPIKHESTAQTGLKNVAGAISMANAGPGTARSDFFILLADQPAFDAGGPGGDANGFAAFGKVTEGMDVVKKIFDSPVSPTKGVGVMKGEMLDPAVKIVSAKRLN